MKVIHLCLYIIVSVCILFTVFFTCMEGLVYNTSYYRWHYTGRNIMQDTQMELNDLMEVTEKMLDYLKGKRGTLNMTAKIDGFDREVFNEREKLHMVDVKRLFVNSTKIRNYSLVLLLVILPLMLWRSKKLLFQALSSIKYVFTGIISLIVLIGILMIVDFNKYFTWFHLLFFSNDLWILNPETDILINMVPEVFFFTTALILLAAFVILSLLVILLGEKVKRRIIPE